MTLISCIFLLENWLFTSRGAVPFFLGWASHMQTVTVKRQGRVNVEDCGKSWRYYNRPSF